MKLFLAILISVIAAGASDGQAAKKAAPKSAAKPAAKPAAKVSDASKPMTIPADAVEGPVGDFRHTDAQGKKWIYRKTPFGVTQLEDNGEQAASRVAAAPGAGITAFDEGDKVRFERKGPFGLWKWEKKKSELDDSEKAALQASQANRPHASRQE